MWFGNDCVAGNEGSGCGVAGNEGSGCGVGNEGRGCGVGNGGVAGGDEDVNGTAGLVEIIVVSAMVGVISGVVEAMMVGLLVLMSVLVHDVNVGDGGGVSDGRVYRRCQ